MVSKNILLVHQNVENSYLLSYKIWENRKIVIANTFSIQETLEFLYFCKKQALALELIILYQQDTHSVISLMNIFKNQFYPLFDTKFIVISENLYNAHQILNYSYPFIKGIYPTDKPILEEHFIFANISD